MPSISRRQAGFLAVVVATALVGCNSTQDVLQPTEPDIAAANAAPAAQGNAGTQATGNAAGQSQPGQQQSAPPSQSQPVAALDPAKMSRARIQFAPIVGTSVEAATALSERLALRARERGMGLTGSGDAATTHVLKGYFTPLTEGKQTTVIYVWDVYDPAGNRVHRISGQLKSPTLAGEGWAAVSPDTMRQIADATIQEFAQWISAAPG